MDKYINDMSGIQQNRYYLQKKLRISACYKSSGMRKSDVGLAPPDVSHCLRLQDLWQRDREEEVFEIPELLTQETWSCPRGIKFSATPLSELQIVHK